MWIQRLAVLANSSLRPNRKGVAILVAAAMLLQTIGFGAGTAYAEDDSTAQPLASITNEYVSTMLTPQGNAVINSDYDRSWDDYVVTSESGLVHPGVLHSRSDLNLMRDMVWQGQEPWSSGFEKLRRSPESAKEVVIYGKGGTQKTFQYPKVSDSSGDKQLRQDATTAYQQALMWYITGDDAYKSNAIAVLDTWAEGLNQFFDTTEPADWDDVALIWGASSVLSSGVAGQKMAAAAEILLYTPSSGWLRDENGNIDYEAKAKYDRFFRLIWQESNKWYGFFNQAAVGNKGYLSIAVFLDDINGYNEAVERFAVNKKAVDAANENPTANTTNFSLASMLLDHGQIVEMGRDQPHSADDVGALAGAARTIFVQGTQLDPTTGMPVESGGVNPYEFQNQKLLKMISYYAQYNLGFDVDYYPNINGLGQKTEWSSVSPSGRGAYAEMVSIYNYYKHIAGYKGQEYDELYKHPEMMIQSGYPEGGSIDRPGFGQLLFTPLAGALEEEPKGPPQPIGNTNDNHYGLYNRHAVIPFSSNNEVYFKNGFVKPNIASYVDEDGAVQYKAEGAMNGNWIGYEGFDFGDKPVDTLAFAYSLNASSGATVTLYVTDPEVKLTDNTMAQTEPFTVFQVPNTGWWTNVNTHVQKLTANSEKLAGVKNIYFKLSGSNNVYNFASEPFWFQFSGAFARSLNQAEEAAIGSETGPMSASNDAAILSNGGYIGYPNVNFDRGTRQLELLHQATGDGTLELRLGGPDGELVKTYPITDTNGAEVTTAFEHETNEVIYGDNEGANDLYFVYVGEGSVELDSFQFGDPDSGSGNDPTRIKGASYQFDNGKAIRSGDRVILLGDGSQAVYRSANMGSRNGDRGFKAIKVKSEEPMMIKAVDLQHLHGASNTVASFEVPNTNGEFVTLAYDLAQSGYSNNEGTLFLRLETSGGTSEGRAEIEYFTFNNDEIEFRDVIQSVNIASNHPGDPSSATAGDTITLSFTAEEPIEDVKVYFGTTAMPVTAMNEEATAFQVSQTLGENYKPGEISFRIDYNVSGSYGKSATVTTDGSEVTIIDEEGLINESFKHASFIDSTPGRATDVTNQIVGALFDRTLGTNTDFRTANGGAGSWIAFDFGVSKKVQLDRVKLLARSDQPGRANGIVIQGTNHLDVEAWTTITNAAVNTINWQTLNVSGNKSYRYLRVYNAGNWFGNMDELKFYGTVADIGEPVALSSVTLSSDHPENVAYARIGDTVTLSFTAEEVITGVQVKLGGTSVPAESEDGIHWTASMQISEAQGLGPIAFTVIYDDEPLVNRTTDGTSVSVIRSLTAAMSDAESRQEDDYTRFSFREFRTQLGAVKESMNEPAYSEIALTLQLADALDTLEEIPLSLYSFENNANNAHGSTHGTVTGTTAYEEGKNGQAIDLNGSTHITLPAEHTLSGYDEITIAAWVNWRGGNAWQRIFDFGNGTNHYMFLSPRSGSNTLRFAIKNGGGEQFVQTAQLAANEWVHVAVTLGSGTAKLYVNGEEKASAAVTIKPSDFKPKVNYIGKAMFNDPLFNGKVDEFRIYGEALGGEDLLKLYNGQLSWVDTSLLDHFLEEAASVDATLYTEISIASLKYTVDAAQLLLSQEQPAQTAIDQSAEALESALGGLVLAQPTEPDELTAELGGPVTASPGDVVEWTVGFSGEAAFSILDVTFKYNPSLFAFDTKEEDGIVFLADEAIVSQHDGIQLLGAAVNAATSEIRILMNDAGGAARSGPLFKLIGSVKEEAGLGDTNVSLHNFEIVTGEGEEATNVETTEAIATMSIVPAAEQPDKSKLQTLVNEANGLLERVQPGTAPGQYPQQAMDAFGAAVVAAEAVLANENATEAAIVDAVSELQAAIAVFRQSVNPAIPDEPANKSALIAALASAEALLASTTVGTKVGQYSPAARSALIEAVNAGKAVNGNVGAAQATVDAAVTVLDSQVVQYRNAIVTLVPGQSKVSIRDLSVIAKYLGTDKNDASWSDIEAADVLGNEQIDISTLAAVARMILEDWLDED